MSSTTITAGRKSRTKLRKLVAAAALAAAIPVPVALAAAAPAEATTQRSGCYVTPIKPSLGPWVQNGQHPDQRVYFNTRVQCPKDRIIKVYDQRWEQDAGPDQYRGQWTTTRTYATGGTVILSHWAWASQLNTESGYDEYYHRVSFKVATIDGVTAWTPWENSPIKSA